MSDSHANALHPDARSSSRPVSSNVDHFDLDTDLAMSTNASAHGGSVSSVCACARRSTAI